MELKRYLQARLQEIGPKISIGKNNKLIIDEVIMKMEQGH